MLESLEQSNIKRMSVEEPEKKASGWFDHESEITDQDKQRMQAELELYRSNDWYNFAYLAADMNELGVTPQITETDKQGMHADLESSRSSNDWHSFADIAANMKALSDSGTNLQIFNNPGLPEQRSF